MANAHDNFASEVN